MTYDKQFYDTKKQKIQQKFQRAKQKWIQMCELSGKEYLDFQQTAQELQEQMKLLEQEELTSKSNGKKV